MSIPLKEIDGYIGVLDGFDALCERCSMRLICDKVCRSAQDFIKLIDARDENFPTLRGRRMRSNSEEYSLQSLREAVNLYNMLFHH